MEMHFYRCEICGKIIAVISGDGIPTVCCGQPMRELIPNMTDGASEKHVPVITVKNFNVYVQVGSIPHPMTESHLITWIGLKTNNGFCFRKLAPGDNPLVTFVLNPGDKPEAAYAYCNIHGLFCVKKEKCGD